MQGSPTGPSPAARDHGRDRSRKRLGEKHREAIIMPGDKAVISVCSGLLGAQRQAVTESVEG